MRGIPAGIILELTDPQLPGTMQPPITTDGQGNIGPLGRPIAFIVSATWQS